VFVVVGLASKMHMTCKIVSFVPSPKASPNTAYAIVGKFG